MRMNRHAVICVALILCGIAPRAAAQNWKNALKDMASNVVDKATDGKATELLMVGSWSYSAPGVKLESDNTLADLGASAMTGKLQGNLKTLYDLVGIRQGGCRFTFASDKSFTAVIGERTFRGTYEYAASSHDVTLRFERLAQFDLGTLTGKAYLSGTDLQLLFPATRLLTMIETLSEKLASISSAASSVETLLKQFESLYLGFEFTKE